MSIRTKTDAIRELKRLFKTRTYHVKIWDIHCVEIKAHWLEKRNIWESGRDIDVEITGTVREKTSRSKTFTPDQVQKDLERFKSSIDHLCESITILAKQQKKRKGIKDRLTPEEDTEYFEELLNQIKWGK